MILQAQHFFSPQKNPFPNLIFLPKSYPQRQRKKKKIKKLFKTEREKG